MHPSDILNKAFEIGYEKARVDYGRNFPYQEWKKDLYQLEEEIEKLIVSRIARVHEVNRVVVKQPAKEH